MSEGNKQLIYRRPCKLNTDSYLSDRARVLDKSNMSLAVGDVQFVNDLVDPLLDQLKVLRSDALGAIDQKHHICCSVAASW